MPERPPGVGPKDLVNWERLRQNPEFQKAFLAVLADRILTAKYPDFYVRSRARLERLRGAGDYSPDAMDLEQKAFEDRLHAQASLEDLRELARTEDLPFPGGEELREMEGKALRIYNASLDSRTGKDPFESEPS